MKKTADQSKTPWKASELDSLLFAFMSGVGLEGQCIKTSNAHKNWVTEAAHYVGTQKDHPKAK